MKKNRMIINVVFSILFIYSAEVDAYSSDTVINGFITQGYMKTDENNFLTDTEEGSFEFNEMGIKFSSAISNNLSIGIQFFARDIGDLGNDDITVDWAFADYLFYNWAGIRIGKIKIPHGFYNESRDNGIARTFIFLPQSVYSDPWRDSLLTIKGAGFYGYLYGLSYQLQIGIMDAQTDGGLAKKFNDITKSSIESIQPETAIIFSLQSTDLIDGLKIGGSVSKWDWKMDLTIQDMPAKSDDEALLWAISIEYAKNAFLFSAEYSIFDVETPIDLYVSPTAAPYRLPYATNNVMEGYYGSISYRMTDWFEIGVYHSIFYSNKKDRSGKDNVKYYNWKDYYSWSKDTCLTFRFDLNQNWIFKLEGHYNDGFYNGYITDNIDKDGNEDVEQYWYLFAAKLMYAF
ncbi:MAG: hypothetical protein KJ737_10030 [Proteobacteria bacterium]|nr:hypothetical protein [Pseudomonadota bacterium]